MILFIALALIWALIRGYRPSKAFREISLFPLAVLEIVFWYFQACAWTGNYSYIRYASHLQMLYILALIWPILKFSLYDKAIVGAIMVAIGSFMNKAVMNANGGKMPVYPTLSKLTGYYTGGALEASGDARHMLMTGATQLGFLGDYIDVGFSIMSPGDVLMHGFVTLVVYGVIRELNRKG